jgi:hypothetical protein
MGVSDLSEQLDECIYPKSEEVLYSSPDGEVLEAIYLVDFRHDEDSKLPINLNNIAEANSLVVIDCEVFAGADEEYPHIALTVRGTVKSIRALSSELDHPPDVLKRLMTTIRPEPATQRLNGVIAGLQAAPLPSSTLRVSPKRSSRAIFR